MNTVVAGADVSDRSRDAIAFARRLAPTELLLACAVPSTSTPPEGLDAVTLVIADGSPARALHTYADARHADLVVVGSSHTGRLGRVLPGSTGEKLLHGSPCAVAVVPRGHEDRPIDASASPTTAPTRPKPRSPSPPASRSASTPGST